LIGCQIELEPLKLRRLYKEVTLLLFQVSVLLPPEDTDVSEAL